MASINGMAVKEYLQALSDEGKIRVEKIGSGNWYWAFLSEEKKARDGELGKLAEEKAKVEAAVAELKGKVEEASEKRKEEEVEENSTREEMGKEQARLGEEVVVLREELNQYKDGDPGELDRKKEEIRMCKEKAERWTDNLMILEQWLGQVLGGDREKMEGIRRTYYGDEYVEGEGLKEL